MVRGVVSGDGWYSNASHVQSPNYNQRPEGAAINLLVIHAIALPPESFGRGGLPQHPVSLFFTNCLDPGLHPSFSELAGVEVSAHFFIERDGAITQFVSCSHRAWHAGVSSFEGRDNCNDFSIGVELEGSVTRPFTQRQYHSLSRLARGLLLKYPIEAITSHAHIAPGRKDDPGPFFRWQHYRDLLAQRLPQLVSGGGQALPRFLF